MLGFIVPREAQKKADRTISRTARELTRIQLRVEVDGAPFYGIVERRPEGWTRASCSA
jgi:hypothetical protein